MTAEVLPEARADASLTTGDVHRPLALVREYHAIEAFLERRQAAARWFSNGSVRQCAVGSSNPATKLFAMLVEGRVLKKGGLTCEWGFAAPA